MKINGANENKYLFYDVSGNIWLDRHTKNAYMINALGLPDKVIHFTDSTSTIEWSDVLNGNIATQEYCTQMAYDETGSRIWMRTTGAGFDVEKTLVPGIGEYSGSRTFHNGQINLTKVDLMGGAFRNGKDGLALFPIKDIQGSVRGYVTHNGLEEAIGYLPYGTPVYFDHRVLNDENKRWQSKEYDEQHEKYYFGARFYDPFFGMWMSPDPATQFANPYSYGGDPINYIDPTGMWSIGLGLVVGHDSKNGWSIGVGAAAEIDKVGYDFSYKFNQDGSKSFNVGVEAEIPIQTPWFYLEINMGMGFAMNTYTGTTLSSHGGVCIGEVGICGGVDTGGSMYWDRGGSFMGATVYAEAYASLGYGMARISLGYEVGLFGMEGRELYAGASAGGFYAQYAQNGGWNWGVGHQFNAFDYKRKEKYSKWNLFGGLYSSESTLLSADYTYTSDVNVKVWGEYLPDYNDKLYTLMAHGNAEGISLDIDGISGFLDGVDLADKLINDKNFNYQQENIIRLYSCNTGANVADGDNVAQILATQMNKTVIAPTKAIEVILKRFGLKRWTSTKIQDNGFWKVFHPK